MVTLHTIQPTGYENAIERKEFETKFDIIKRYICRTPTNVPSIMNIGGVLLPAPRSEPANT